MVCNFRIWKVPESGSRRVWVVQLCLEEKQIQYPSWMFSSGEQCLLVLGVLGGPSIPWLIMENQGVC